MLFQEDDYLYTSASWPYRNNTTYDGLIKSSQFAEYVSFYDHPDKYLFQIWGNKFITDKGVENTGIFRQIHGGDLQIPTCTFATTSMY